MAYVKLVDYAAKDALLTGNPSKVIKGTELGAEFDSLATEDALNVKTTGTNTVASVTHAATSKTTPVDADEIPISDSAASWALKKLTWANLKAAFINTINSWTAQQKFTKSIETAKGANIASAATCDIWTPADGNFLHITGTATITSFGTAPQAGAYREIEFDGALTLTHNATTLVLPGGANITTAAGDSCIVYADTTANMHVVQYTKATGKAIIETFPAAASQAQMEAASSNVVVATPANVGWHPCMPKAWCVFNGTLAGTNAPTAGYGVTSVTRNATGDYTVTFSTAFSSANFAIFFTLSGLGTSGSVAIVKSATQFGAPGGNQTTTTVAFQCSDYVNTLHDYGQICVSAFGDQ